MASVLLMCLGSLMIAVLPGYAVLGPAAPALLVLARVIQGLSLGGEYGSSATYLAEMSPPGRRGFWSSFQYVTLIGGQLLALGVLLLLQAVLPGESELRAWGWRLGFGFGAALALVTLWMRRGLPETEAFERQGEGARRSAKLRALLEHPRESLIVVGLTMGGTLAFYVYTIYMQKFLRLSGGLTTPQATAVVAGSLAVALLLQPAYGALSDRIGRRPLLLGFGVLGTLFTAPLLSAIRSAGSPGEAFLWLVLAWLIVSGYTSINAVVKAELFPASVRATGVGVPYAVAVSVFGGSAEYVALWFKDQGHETWFYGYATAVIACSLVVYALLREPLRTSRIEAEAKGGTARP
jgi:MHS family alpha-ketoglutarate permease-like MFS transporter